MSERKGILLRLDPAVHDALARRAADDLRSTNAQIEFLLRRALADAGRLSKQVGAMRGPGRPARATHAYLAARPRKRWHTGIGLGRSRVRASAGSTAWLPGC
jgi:hypothetical protein